MYQKKDYIVNENYGVCLVEDITKISVNSSNPVSYYVLKPVYDKSNKAYIPVEGHKVVLRDLMSQEEATVALESLREKNMQRSRLAELDDADKRLAGEIAFVLKKDISEILNQ